MAEGAMPTRPDEKPVPGPNGPRTPYPAIIRRRRSPVANPISFQGRPTTRPVRCNRSKA
jgi:hypothetical protein